MKRIAKALPLFLMMLVPLSGASAGEAVKAPAAKVYKIADLYKEKASLADKKVTVKGKVVKVSVGIMGKNWIHIQDGSGDAAKKTNDLTVTTNAEVPAEGKKVTVTGTLRKDKDFGAGYFYQVIVEDATIKH